MSNLDEEEKRLQERNAELEQRRRIKALKDQEAAHKAALYGKGVLHDIDGWIRRSFM